MTIDNSIKITQNGLFSRFVERHKNRPNSPFCFILGAGASKQSGIPAGKELALQWLKELHEEKNFERLGFEAWAKTPQVATLLGTDAFMFDKIGEYYSSIYECKFKKCPEDGFAAIEQMMEKVRPSYGYSVLAYILATTSHKVVITPNFDNLVADALFLHCETFPLIIGHDELVNYVQTDLRRPLIAKIHGDRGFPVKNRTGEINCISDGWSVALTKIFTRYVPIVIGYAGNDGTLMGLMEKLEDGKPETIYWCYRKGDDPSEKVVELVKKKNGWFVEIEGFDEVMMRLQDKAKGVIDFGDISEKLSTWSKGIVDNFVNQKKELGERIAKADQSANVKICNSEKSGIVTSFDGDEESLLSVAAKVLPEKGTKQWWEWRDEIQNEKNDDEKQKKWIEALELFPDNANLLLDYAEFIADVRKDSDKADEYYQKAITVNPSDEYALTAYAGFLKDERGDNDKAEEYYLKAITVKPVYGFALTSYANFLKDIRNDTDKAEEYYQKALAADPSDEYALTRYAEFLKGVRKDNDKAEEYFKKVCAVAPNYSYALIRYAEFLKDEREDNDKAEEYYQKTLIVDPNDEYTLTLYAEFLKDIRKDTDKAEEYYQKALAVNPNYEYALFCYAEFLKNIRNKNEEVSE